MKKKKIILPSARFAEASDEDLNIRLDLNESKNLLREGDRDVVLDLSKLFDDERNRSKKYNIYGKIKMIFRNMYFGNTDYTYLKDRLYLVGNGSTYRWDGYMPYDEFAFLRTDVVRELNVINKTSTLGYFLQNIVVTGSTGHTLITPITAPYQNWNLYLSYVYDTDDTIPMKYTLSGNTVRDFVAGDGIPFRVYDKNNYYKLVSPVEHGMSQGEYIVINGGSFNNSTPFSGKTFLIESVGDEVFESEKYVVNILKSQFNPSTSLSNIVVCKRCIDINNPTKTLSKYYVHKHKTLTNVNDYILDKASFESPIWEDEKKILFENFSGENDVVVDRNRMESVLFGFKKPLSLEGLVNNLGYTPTEVYLTIIFRNGNGYFIYPPKVGYEFNFHNSWVDNHFSGSTSNENSLTFTLFSGNTNLPGYTGFTFTSGQTIPVGTILRGAFVEYNEFEYKERIVSESYHRFSSRGSSTSTKNNFYHFQDDPSYYSGASINNMVGLYYQPHYRIKLRELSPYVETYKGTDIYNLPENARFDTSTNEWRWRDLYSHGYVDVDGYGTNYPFLNDTHQVKLNIDFYLKNELFYNNKENGVTKFKNKNLNENC
jgi:hypothetical protein